MSMGGFERIFGKGGASPFSLVPHIEHADFETEFFDRIAAAAEDWDGKTDPIRPGFPA